MIIVKVIKLIFQYFVSFLNVYFSNGELFLLCTNSDGHILKPFSLGVYLLKFFILKLYLIDVIYLSDKKSVNKRLKYSSRIMFNINLTEQNDTAVHLK